MQDSVIYITDLDLERLSTLLANTGLYNRKDQEYFGKLEEELDSAYVVSSQDIPNDILTINSRAQVRDLDSGKEIVLTLVLPVGANYEHGRVSILAPVGAALFGRRIGDTVVCRVPGGVRRLKVERVFYQPEAAGDYHL